jgi:HK97 family phage major capsid protein
MENEKFVQINQQLDLLQDNFMSFEKKYEEKMKKMITASARPNFANFSEDKNVDEINFVNYVKSGQKSLTSSDGNSGSYLIPESVVRSIQEKISRNNCMRNLCKITSIRNDNLEILLDKKDGEAGWVSEVQERSETETPELNRLQISVHEMYAKPRVSQKILDDSQINVEFWLSEKIADKFAMMENLSFIQGDGEGKPKGFLSYPRKKFGEGNFGSLEEIATGIDGGLDSVDVLIDTIGSLKTSYLNGCVWLMSRGALTCIKRLKDYVTDKHIWQPSANHDKADTLFGFPVVVSDDMPALVPSKKSTSIAFGNFYHGYQIVDRNDFNILRDPFSAKPFVEFYTTKRVGGDVVDFDAIKLINFSKE